MLAGAGATIIVLPVVSLPANAESVNVADGTAKISLLACGQSNPVTTERLPDCSYVAIPTKPGDLYYAYLTAPGDITWTGTVSQGSLTFPASGQLWPRLAFLDGVATNTVKASDITGTVDSNGVVALRVNYETTIQALGFTCSAKGQISMSSDATDPIGGGQGRAVDTATGAFAVAATAPTVPTLTGAACVKAAENLDLSKGVGWYLAGFLKVESGSSPQGATKQTAVVKYPRKLARKGKTVILKRAVVTNAGNRAAAKVTWSRKRGAKGKSKRYASVKVTRAGRITIKTTGKARRLYVRLRLSAPATAGYEAFRVNKVWRVR